MATPAFSLLLTIFIIAFTYPSSTFSLSSRAIISHASSNENYNNDHSFASILAKKSFTSEINFCSLANRACSSELNQFKPFASVYEVYKGIDNESPITLKVDSSSFFRKSALVPGKKIYLSKSQEEFPERALLSAPIILIYPNKELQQLLSQSFVTSTTKEAIQSTVLKYCNAPTLKGSEFKSCPKSLKEMVEFSKAVLGGGKPLVALTTKSLKVLGASKELLIGDVKMMNVDKMMSCHGVLLDSATYFCHLTSSTQVYVVDVIDPETKALANTVLATCHMDTSAWSKDHVAFKILKSSPGKTEACHWNTELDLAWVGGDH